MLVGSINATTKGRGYITFDLSGITVPEGATLTNAMLQTTVTRTSINTTMGDLQLQLSDPSTPVDETGATWNSIDGLTSWTTGGGDPTGVVLSTLDGSSTEGAPQYHIANFNSSQAFVDAVNAAIAGDGLLEMVVMSTETESRDDRNFVGLYTDDFHSTTKVPTLNLAFGTPQQTDPTSGETVAFVLKGTSENSHCKSTSVSSLACEVQKCVKYSASETPRTRGG